MAKVTVYVTEDQLHRLRRMQGGGRGNISRAFQAFIDNATAGSPATGRYDYARKLMPLSAAIERHRIALGAKVQSGGPPADGGPVAAALTLLVYKRLLESDPSLGAKLEKEFARFGLDELVATETEGVDLLAEPEVDDDVDDEQDGPQIFGFNPIEIGQEVAQAFRHGGDFADIGALIGPKAAKGRRRVRRVEVDVTADDDPREALTVVDFEAFQRRHADWETGAKLTPSQIETVADLLRGRAHRQRLRDEE